MAMLFYTGLIHHNADGFGIVFPDLPGCVTVGDTLDDLARRAHEALALHLSGMQEDDEALPKPTPLDLIASDPEYPEIGRIVVGVDLTVQPEQSRAVRVNITLQESLLFAIDKAAAARGLSRSGFLAEAARHEMTV